MEKKKEEKEKKKKNKKKWFLKNIIYILMLVFFSVGIILILETDNIDSTLKPYKKIFFEYIGIASSVTSILLGIGSHIKLNNEKQAEKRSRKEAERRNIYFNSIENASNLIKEISSIEDYLEANNYDSAKSILPSIKRHFHQIASTIHANKSVLKILTVTKTYSYQIEFENYIFDNTEPLSFKNKNDRESSKNSEGVPEKETNSKNSDNTPNFLIYYSVLIPQMEQFISDIDALLMIIINENSDKADKNKEPKKETPQRYLTPVELKIITKNFQGICSFIIDFKTIIKNHLK